MSNGKVVVILLVLAAVFGAWLGPAGDRVDPQLGPMEAFFKRAIRLAGQPERIYLAVSEKGAHDPPPALMARFAGDIVPFSRRQGPGCLIEITLLEWKSGREAARCEGSVQNGSTATILGTELHLTSRGQWVVDRAETYDPYTQKWSLISAR